MIRIFHNISLHGKNNPFRIMNDIINNINQIRSDQIRSDQIRSDQIRSDQIRSDQIRSDRRKTQTAFS